MIPRHEGDGDASIGRFEEGFECHSEEFRWDLRSIEQIAAMDHQIDLFSNGGAEGLSSVGEEIGTATSTFDPRAKREVEPEMGVGEEENAEGHRAQSRLSWRWKP